MPFPARKCGDFLFVDGIISVLIPVSIQALVPILMPVLMLTSRPRKFSATIFLGSIAGPDYACLVRVFFARWFLPGGALRIKSHPFSPILRAPENRSGRSYAEQPLNLWLTATNIRISPCNSIGLLKRSASIFCRSPAPHLSGWCIRQQQYMLKTYVLAIIYICKMHVISLIR